jgi:broad specificity phosphatase PhoE
LERVKAYEQVYQTLEDDEGNGDIAYLKVINVGEKIVARHCTGFVTSQVAFYLQNIHISPRKIWLSLYADNEDSVKGILGGDGGILTEAGRQYSMDLARFVAQEEVKLEGRGKQILVIAGTMKVHTETIHHLQSLYACSQTSLLNELRGGDFHGKSREEIKRDFPEEYAKREADKLHYRYPGPNGESYLDVIERVRPVIIELERQRRSVVVVCHLAVLRCIYAYFMGTPMNELPFLEFPLHKVL